MEKTVLVGLILVIIAWAAVSPLTAVGITVFTIMTAYKDSQTKRVSANPKNSDKK